MSFLSIQLKKYNEMSEYFEYQYSWYSSFTFSANAAKKCRLLCKFILEEEKLSSFVFLSKLTEFKQEVRDLHPSPLWSRDDSFFDLLCSNVVTTEIKN
jgi:hypothetical protein